MGSLEDSLPVASERNFTVLPPTHLKAQGGGDLPREKLIKYGADSLTDEELLALLFGTGTQGLNVIEMSRALIKQYGSLTGLSRVELKSLMAQKGVGPAKAIHLVAALALGKRLAHERFRSEPMDSPERLIELLGPEMRQLSKECLRVVLLTAKHTLISVQEVHKGTVSEVQANIRDILKPVIVQGAFAFLIAHNHPSGDANPSGADKAFTHQLKEAARLMRIPFVDHVIIGQCTPAMPQGYFSFREHGLL